DRIPIQEGQPHPNRSREWRFRADGVRLVSPRVHAGQARAGYHLSQRAVSVATPIASGGLKCPLSFGAGTALVIYLAAGEWDSDVGTLWKGTRAVIGLIGA